MTIKVGDRLPNVTVRLVTPDGPKPVETKDYFAGKKIVLFGPSGVTSRTVAFGRRSPTLMVMGRSPRLWSRSRRGHEAPRDTRRRALGP